MGNLEPLARTYPAGVTSWVEVAQQDVDAGIAFYGGLFGWEFEDVLPPDAPGRYAIATLGGLDVASISGPVDGAAAWATYVAVDDADAVAAAMVEHGAELLEPPADAGPGGRGATVRDPQGAQVRLWEARRRLGAQLHELPRRVELQRPAHLRPRGGGDVYAEDPGVAHRRPGVGRRRSRCRGTATTSRRRSTRTSAHRQASAPDGFRGRHRRHRRSPRRARPPHWHVTFTVADRRRVGGPGTRRSAAAVLAPGGETTGRATPSSRDPQGASFTVSQFAPEVLVVAADYAGVMSTTVDLPLLPLGRGKDPSSERGVECPAGLPPASDPDLVARATAAKRALGDRLFVLGHHYQRDEVINFADVRGDSYKLSQGRPAPEGRVHRVLRRPLHGRVAPTSSPRRDSGSILPDLAAGCSMADMARLDAGRGALGRSDRRRVPT